MSEYRSTISNLVTKLRSFDFLQKSDVVDALNSSSANVPLSANQGKILNESLAYKVSTSDVVNNLTTTSSGKVLDARQGKALSDLIGDAITYINS